MTHSPAVSLPVHACACSKAHKQSGHDRSNEDYTRCQCNELLCIMADLVEIIALSSKVGDGCRV